ncbi:MAG: HAD-IIB family hydrolase, partial [Mycoplasma sp.]|nr:HAD-IIB family hydrolase [Mycoplasma sp.]
MEKINIMDKINLIDLDSFVFDLDNTLVFNKENISLKTIEIIKALLKNNKKVIIATGRPHFLAKRIYKLLNLKTPIISINGAHIYDMENKTSIFTKTIDNDISKKVFTILTNNNMQFLIYEKQILNFYQAYQTKSNWINWLTK